MIKSRRGGQGRSRTKARSEAGDEQGQKQDQGLIRSRRLAKAETGPRHD